MLGHMPEAGATDEVCPVVGNACPVVGDACPVVGDACPMQYLVCGHHDNEGTNTMWLLRPSPRQFNTWDAAYLGVQVTVEFLII